MDNIISHMIVHGQRIGITAETIHKTWLWFADNNQGCIDEVLNGDVFINPDFKDEYLADKAYYKQSNIESAKNLDIPSGTSLWFWQRAYYIQEGESVPILG